MDFTPAAFLCGAEQTGRGDATVIPASIVRDWDQQIALTGTPRSIASSTSAQTWWSQAERLPSAPVSETIRGRR